AATSRPITNTRTATHTNRVRADQRLHKNRRRSQDRRLFSFKGFRWNRAHRAARVVVQIVAQVSRRGSGTLIQRSVPDPLLSVTCRISAGAFMRSGNQLPAPLETTRELALR